MHNHTNMRSKEEVVLEPFFNSSKHWHFDELVNEVDISRSQLSQWLKKFVDQGVLIRIKPKGKMPYYTQNFENPDFQLRKKLFALRQLTESGLLSHLASLKDARVVILFGSFASYDWYNGSDIDIFIYGNDEKFEQGKYELNLKREIQLHTAKTKKDLNRMDKILPYIITGNFIKGSIEDLGVEVHAKV
jgi:predicted nucleotidyltransferase